MKGILKRIERKEFIKQDKKTKFEKIEFTVDVIYGDNKVRTLQGSYSVDFARRYFTYTATITGKKMQDHIGDEVEVVTEKRSYDRKDDGGKGVYEYIKFVNVLDADGKAIRLPNNDDKENFDF